MMDDTQVRILGDTLGVIIGIATGPFISSFAISFYKSVLHLKKKEQYWTTIEKDVLQRASDHPASNVEMHDFSKDPDKKNGVAQEYWKGIEEKVGVIPLPVSLPDRKAERCAFSEVFQGKLDCLHDLKASETISTRKLITIIESNIAQCAHLVAILAQVEEEIKEKD